MISFIKGTVSYKESDSVIVENHGIGYQLKASARVLESVREGEDVLLYTYLYVREDMLSLFGFLRRDELSLFRILLGITGIGPKVALSVLSTMTVEELYYAVFEDDAKRIAKTPGIGPKGARRMIIELKDKLDLGDLEDVSGAGEGVSLPSAIEGDSISDTVQALVALGYSGAEAYHAVRKVADAEQLSAEVLLKEALKKLL